MVVKWMTQRRLKMFKHSGLNQPSSMYLWSRLVWDIVLEKSTKFKQLGSTQPHVFFALHIGFLFWHIFWGGGLNPVKGKHARKSYITSSQSQSPPGHVYLVLKNSILKANHSSLGSHHMVEKQCNKIIKKYQKISKSISKCTELKKGKMRFHKTLPI